ncbi:MAG: hypothetical protein AAFV07_07560 [Bacteroidota bacterium]
MRFSKYLLSLVMCCTAFGPVLLYAQNSAIQVIIPSAEAESDYIWQTLQDLPFFESYKYQLRLPSGDLMDSLKEKARANTLTDADYQALQSFVRTSVYRQEDYAKGFKKIAEQLPFLDKMINRWRNLDTDWSMHAPPVYQVMLTLYGPGGSYNPDEGSILIYTTPDGRFKQYDNPANTLIHEIVHIGIEASLIQPYSASHPLKERMVDLIVQICFGPELPDYRLQPFEGTGIDKWLQTEADVERLDHIMQKLTED